MAPKLLLGCVPRFPSTNFLDSVAFAKDFALKLYFKLRFPLERQGKKEKLLEELTLEMHINLMTS